jgi:tetratricopeptide (TPR) repeat protein
MDEFPEGRSFVQAALDAVSRAGMAPVDMRYFAARDGKPADYCRQRVRECEIYVAVIGFRYGSMVPSEAVSYTELEFDEASSAGLPRLVFLLDKPAGMSVTLVDADRGAVEGFRQRLRSAGLVVRAFTSAAGLELEVFHALTEVSVPSAVRGTGLPVPAVRYSLPPEAPTFIGRDGELGRITAGITDAAGSGGVVTIRAIDGMPGVGKTALALRVAHELSARFPDRQLFIDLHAHTPGRQPVAPEDALAGLLVAAGVDPRFVPGDLDGRAAMWRDQMAGQRALLVLDNAASSAQVTPLLPGGGTCLVLVTSRRHLGDLPSAVTPVMLDVLPAEQAEEMFTRLAPRAAADQARVAEIVRLAGFLPLAVSLLARVFARHRSWTLADLAAETRGSLLTLKAEHHSIAAAFEVSYRHLEPARQRFFGLLGLHPGTTVDRYAAAALADISPGEAEGLLDALHGEGLVTETGRRRYGMHDLLRRYARDHAVAPAADQALGRLLDYYQRTATIAGDRLARRTRPGPSPATPTAPAAAPALEDAGQALAWARTERDNLLACLDHATRDGQHARVIALTAALAELLRRDGPWADAIVRHAAAVRVGRLLDGRLGLAGALNDLGDVLWLTGDFPGAIQALEESLGIYDDVGDDLGRANALLELGLVRRGTGDFDGAAQILGESLGIYRDLGDERGQANALLELGTTQRLTGDFPGAAENLEESLDIFRDIGSRLGQANALTNLGIVRRRIGDFPGAAENLEESLDIFRDIGSRLGQANALANLGIIGRLTGDLPAAADAAQEALGIYRDIGYRQGQANVASDLGVVRRLMGDFPAALRAAQEALGIFRDIGDMGGEAEALNEAGTLHRVRGDLTAAGTCHRLALDLSHKTGSPRDEAHALAGLARCALGAGKKSEAAAGLRQAQEIFKRIGAAEAKEVSEELNGLTEEGPADEAP